MKRQVGSAGRQLRCSASPSTYRAVDRGAPSHQKGSPPDVPGEASRRTCPARCALSTPFVARGTAVWIIQPSGGTVGALASPVPHDQRLTRCPRGVEASSVGPERMCIASKGACLGRDAVCRETPLPVHGRARGIAEGTTPRAAEAFLNRSGEFHSEHGAVMVDGLVEPVRESHVTCSLSSHRRPLCCSSRRGSCGSGTERRFWCTGRDIGLPRGASAARSPELLFGVSMSARRRRTPTWAARYGAPAPAARLVIHVHLLWSCTVCRTLWTTSSGQLSRM